MASVEDLNDLKDVERYWNVANAALLEIFGAASTDQIKRLRSKLAQRPMQEQLLLLHREPLYVAADLAGRTVRDEDLEKYAKLIVRLRWTA